MSAGRRDPPGIPLALERSPRAAPGMRAPLCSGPAREPELIVQSPFGSSPAGPPGGAGGGTALCPRNCRLSNSCESSK